MPDRALHFSLNEIIAFHVWMCVGVYIRLERAGMTCEPAGGGGGGHSGTERLPTAKRPRRAEAVNNKI